jgi:hypothetical protein
MSSPGVADAVLEPEVGQIVIGSDAERLGQVKEITEQEFRVDVRLAPDVAIPRSQIAAIAAGIVILKVPAAIYHSAEHAPRHI